MDDAANAWRAAREARKAEQQPECMAKAREKLGPGWSPLGEYSFRRMIRGQPLDYWPNTNAVRWDNRAYRTSMNNVIRIAEGLEAGLSYKEARSRQNETS